MARDPFSSVQHFTQSLSTDAGYTLKTAAVGLANSGSIEGLHKYSTPLLGLGGLGLAFSGAVSGNLLAIGIGGVSLATSAARYFEHGEEIAAKAKAPTSEPPAPPPPV